MNKYIREYRHDKMLMYIMIFLFDVLYLLKITFHLLNYYCL